MTEPSHVIVEIPNGSRSLDDEVVCGLRSEIAPFFSIYKQPDVRVEGWLGAEGAVRLLDESRRREVVVTGWRGRQ